jgi:hypothetical protein
MASLSPSPGYLAETVKPQQEPTVTFYVGAIDGSLDELSDELDLLISESSHFTRNDTLSTATSERDGALSGHGKELEAILNRILVSTNRIANLRSSLDR